MMKGKQMPLNIRILYYARPDQEEPFVEVCWTVSLFEQHFCPSKKCAPNSDEF